MHRGRDGQSAVAATYGCFIRSAGIRLNRGSPLCSRALFSALARAAPLIKSGKARGLGVSSAKRHPQLPEIPAIAEAGLNGFDVTGWSGLCAPAATPAPIITKLGGDLRKALALPQTQQRAMELGIEIMSSTSSEFSAFIQA